MPDNVEDNPVEKREALLADRLRLHKGYRQRFVKGRNRHGRIHAFHQSLSACLVPKLLERPAFPAVSGEEPSFCLYFLPSSI